MTLYRDGASSFLDVVTAQSAALEAERLAIILHTRELETEIGLMLALGGGWTVTPPPPPPPVDFTPDPVQLVNDLSKAIDDRRSASARRLWRLRVLAQAQGERGRVLPPCA